MVEAPDATVALSLLAVASLATQGLANVEISNRTYPLSLFCLTIAESGDRKSSVDKVALTPIEDYRCDRLEAYKADKKQWYINHAAWKAQKEAILKETAKATTLDTRRQKLEELGEEPNPPLDPDLIIPSSTIEGIARNWDKMQPSIGLFSDEGGNFLGGYGFKSENKIYTTTALTSLWGDGGIKKLTSGNGKESVKGKRLAIHLMVQPLIGDEFFKDKAMENQGFTNRFLIAFPESKKGYRRNEEPTSEQLKAIRRYSDKIAALLRLPLTIIPDGNQLSPLTLYIEGEAKTALKKFSDQCEFEQRPEGKFCEISGFASRACEHACRLAGVLQLVSDPFSSIISNDRMTNAINLMVWFLNERIRLLENGKVKPEQRVAEQILEWCKKQSEPEIRKNTIAQYAPYAARQDKVLLKKALSHLIEEGLLLKTKDSPESYSVMERSS